MSDYKIKYCFKCGAELPEPSDFCPECGANLTGKEEPQRAEYTARPTQEPPKGDMGIIPILIMVYGVLAIVAGIFMIMVGMSIDSIITIAREYAESMDPQTRTEILAVIEVLAQLNMIYFTAIAILMMLSGIFALVAGHLAGKVSSWKTALVCCLVASLVPLFSIPLDMSFHVSGSMIGTILISAIGLLMTYFIYAAKDKFIS